MGTEGNAGRWDVLGLRRGPLTSRVVALTPASEPTVQGGWWGVSFGGHVNCSGDRDPSFCTPGSDCGDIPPIPWGPVLHRVLLHAPLPRVEVLSSPIL